MNSLNKKFELSQKEKDKMDGVIRYGPNSMSEKFNPTTKVKQNKLSKDDANILARLLVTYFRTSRNYHAHQFIKLILRPKKDREEVIKHVKRMVELGKEMNELANQIDKILEK